MKMTEKKKRYLAVGGGIILCAGIMAAIGLQFAKPSAGEDRLPEKDLETAQSAVPEDVQELFKEDEADQDIERQEMVIQFETGNSGGDTQSQPSGEEDPLQTDTEEPEQSIQPEVEKPEKPEEEVLTNPEEKPDGTKVETSPEPTDHDTYVPPKDTDGGGNGGLPGFDSVPYGGPNAEGYADDMYENGNKIGDM